MKLVKFANGKYGIRKGWIFKEYLDLTTQNHYWWSQTSKWFVIDCQVETSVFYKLIHGVML